MSKMKRDFSKFTTERRLEMIAQAMREDLSAQQLFSTHETELTSYGVTNAKDLYTILYQKSLKIANNLRRFYANREAVQKILANPTGKEQLVAQLKTQLDGFARQKLNPLEHEYSSLQSAATPTRSNTELLDSFFAELDSE